MRLLLLAACALTGASLTFATHDDPAANPASVPKVAKSAPKVAALEKIAVIGASFSAGYGMDKNPNRMAESTLHLSHVIEASLIAPHEKIDDQATAAFFMDPKGTSARALESLRASKPSAIVAIDYLFWFGYGVKRVPKTSADAPKADPQAKEAQRIAELDAALADLGTFTCPILLGDLPDMTIATQAPEPMITKSMVPAAATLKTMNEHIAAFAKAHANIVVVPLCAMTAKMQADEEISLRGNTWPKGSAERLMQEDKLHTTVDGTCAVWIMAVDAWLNAQKDLPAGSFELDAAKLAAKVAEAAKATPPVEKKKPLKKAG
jgi:hypothetical protein